MKFTTKVSAVFLTFVASVVFGSSAWGCTGVIIGSDLTEDGSTIVGRTEDLEQNHPKRLLVHEAGTYPAGKAIVGAETGVSYAQDKDSLKFTSISDTTPDEGRFDEAGFNSAGVAIDATVSAKANKKITAVDPYTKKGWTEGVLATVLLANATSAKDAVDRMAALIEADGASEGNSFVAADASEVWFMEIYSGRQYAAMKYPKDSFSVIPNTFFINHVNCADAESFVCSASLEKVARDADSYVETNGSFDPAASYGTGPSAGNSSRSFAGIKALDPGASVSIEQGTFPLLNTPSASFTKLSIADVMAMQRNRFEGVDDALAAASLKVVDDSKLKDAAGEPVAGARYPVGNTNTMEAHIFQLPAAGMPATVPGTLWQTVGTPQGSPYLPYYGLITSTIEPLRSSSHDPQDMSSYYWLTSAINGILAGDRTTVQAPVREYLAGIETPLIERRAGEDRELAAKFAADPAAAATWATEQFTDVSSAAVSDMTRLLAALKVYNTEHRLTATDGSYVTVAPKQIILPTVFTATPLDKVVARNAQAAGARADGETARAEAGALGWDLALTREMPNGVREPAVLDKPVSVTLKVAGELEGGRLYRLDGDARTEVAYTAGDGVITFEAAELGRMVFEPAALPSPTPTGDPTATPTGPVAPTSSAPTSVPSAAPTHPTAPTTPAPLARTGGNILAAGLLAITLAGTGTLLARRKRS